MTRHKNGEVQSRENIEKLYEKFSIPRKEIGPVLKEINRDPWQRKPKLIEIPTDFSNSGKTYCLTTTRKYRILDLMRTTRWQMNSRFERK